VAAGYGHAAAFAALAACGADALAVDADGADVASYLGSWERSHVRDVVQAHVAAARARLAQTPAPARPAPG
jgi:hypothetical protein